MYIHGFYVLRGVVGGGGGEIVSPTTSLRFGAENRGNLCHCL